MGRAADKRPKDRGDGVQDIPGSRGAGRRGINTEDDGGGTEFQGYTEKTGALPISREGIGKGVTGGAPPNPSRRGKRGVGVGGRQGRRGKRSQDLQDGLSRESSTKALPSQRV